MALVCIMTGSCEGPPARPGVGQTTAPGSVSDTYEPPAGSTAMVRIGNFMLPTHLQFDLCLSPSGRAEFTVGPIFRATHEAGLFGGVTRYRLVPPGSYRARFVQRDSVDCESTIVGMPDLALEVPLAGERRYTFALSGDITRDPPAASLRVLEDEVTVPDGRVALRIVHLAPAAGGIDFGAYASYGRNGEMPDPESFAAIIVNQQPLSVSSGDANGYFFVPREPNAFFTTFGFRQHGATTDFYGSQRTLDPVINSGAWTFFIEPDSRRPANGVMCRDGLRANEPRLCYPCGFPNCEGR